MVNDLINGQRTGHEGNSKFKSILKLCVRKKVKRMGKVQSCFFTFLLLHVHLHNLPHLYAATAFITGVIITKLYGFIIILCVQDKEPSYNFFSFCIRTISNRFRFSLDQFATRKK